MLGWNISVHRQADGGAQPARADSKTGDRIAAWQTGLSGMDWLKELASGGQALDLGGDGYPFSFTAQSKHLVPTIEAGPPCAHEYWHSDPGDILGPNWDGKTTVDQDAVSKTGPEEWLLVIVFDES